MSEEAINRLLRREIGCTIHEINAMIGYWLEKYDKERTRNKKLQEENLQLKEKIEKVKEYVIKEQRTLLDCEVVYTDTLLKILKGDTE